MKRHSITKLAQYSGGSKIRADVPDFVHATATALQKRVCQRAEEFELSGDPADVVAKAALTKCGHQRNMLWADYQAFLHERDERCGPEMAGPISVDEIDRHIAESQPIIEMFERDLLDLVTLAIVEFRAAKNSDAPNR